MIVRWPASHLCALVLISTPAIAIAEETAEEFHETFEFSEQSGGGYGGRGPAGGGAAPSLANSFRPANRAGAGEASPDRA